jgi:hypothetical protein
MSYKNKLKKVLFPFAHKYPELHKYWWHSLFVVIFFIAVLSILFSVYISLIIAEMDSYARCVHSNVNLGLSMNQGCDVFVVQPALNFSGGLLASMVSFYLLQLIYYKIFVNIVFRNKFKNEN